MIPLGSPVVPEVKNTVATSSGWQVTGSIVSGAADVRAGRSTSPGAVPDTSATTRTVSDPSATRDATAAPAASVTSSGRPVRLAMPSTSRWRFIALIGIAIAPSFWQAW